MRRAVKRIIQADREELAQRLEARAAEVEARPALTAASQTNAKVTASTYREAAQMVRRTVSGGRAARKMLAELTTTTEPEAL